MLVRYCLSCICLLLATIAECLAAVDICQDPPTYSRFSIGFDNHGKSTIEQNLGETDQENVYFDLTINSADDKPMFSAYKPKSTDVERILLLKFLLEPWSFLTNSTNTQRLGGTESFHALKGKVAAELRNLKEGIWQVDSHHEMHEIKFSDGEYPQDLISKLANCAWPKHRFDSLRLTLDETSDCLRHINRKTVRSLETSMKEREDLKWWERWTVWRRRWRIWVVGMRR